MTTNATYDDGKPFVGLAPFTESDALYFFGREADRAVITSNLVAARLTVLYGPSGCGKSSLLDAGVAHEINRVRAPRQISARGAAEFVVVTSRDWRDDPKRTLLERVRETVESVLDRPLKRPPDHLHLADALRAWADALDGLDKQLRGTLLIVLDQFEDYFLYHGRKVVNGTFAKELADTLGDAQIRANFMISLREDALAQLDAFEGYVPGLLANTLRLDRLDRERGRETIEGPVERYNDLHGKDGRTMAIGPGLIDAVLETVEAGAITLETAGRGRVGDREEDDSDRPIETAYLQLVMTRLWEAEAEAGSSVLTLETFHRLGGAENIVSTHLDTVMATFEEQQRDVAANLFRYLVTPTGTKIALTLNDLADYTSLPAESIRPVLIRLGSQQVRILREVSAPLDEEGKSRYEIFHDVLAAVIGDWRHKYVTEQAKLEEARKAEAAQREEAAKAEAQRRRVRFKVLVGTATAVLFLTTTLSVIALYQASIARKEFKKAKQQELLAEKSKERADDEKTRADLQAKIAQSSNLAAQSALVLDSDPDHSLALAVAAVKTQRTAAAERSLRQAVAGSYIRAVLGDSRGKMVAVAYSPDGRQIATANVDGTAEIWDTATGGRTKKFDNVTLTGRGLAALAFGGAGRYLTTVDEGGVVVVHQLASDSKPLKIGPAARQLWTASFTPDGSRVAVATDDKKVRVWELPSGKALPERNLQEGRVTRLAFSSDGKTLAAVDGRDSESTAAAPPGGVGVSTGAPAASQITTVRLWEIATGNQGPPVEEPLDISAVVFSADGRRLATGTRTGLVKVWDLAYLTCALARTITQYQEIADIAFNAKGTLLATASKDSTAQLWDPNTGAGRGVMNCLAPVLRVTFGPDGEHVLIVSEDKTARVWPVGANESIVLRGHTNSIRDAVFSPDGLTVATASTDGTARIWDSSPGPRPIVLSGPLATSSNAVFSPDSRLLVAACADNVTRRWDVATGQPKGELHGDVGPVVATAISSDGRQLATAGSDRIARVWDASSGKVLQELRGHDAPLTSVSFSPDDRQLATASHDGTARLWNLESGQLRGVLTGHRAPVTGIAFRRDGARLATAGLDYTIRVWDTTTCSEVSRRQGYSSRIASSVFSPDGHLITASMGVNETAARSRGSAKIINVDSGRIRALDGHSGTVSVAQFSSDGKTVATAGFDRTVRLWDGVTGEARAVLYGHDYLVGQVAFSSKDSYLASDGYDGTGIIWDARKSVELFRLPGLIGQSPILAFKPDETMLATVNGKFTAQLWDVATGKVAQTLDGHTNTIQDLAFSPDGLLAATTSFDGTARLWDVKTGKAKKRFDTHGYGVSTAVKFSPDGREFATADNDGKARLWDARGDSSEPRTINDLGSIPFLAYSKDGAILAIGGVDGAIRVVDTQSLKVTIGGTRWSGTSWYLPTFSPDASRLVTVGNVGSALVWDTKAGSQIRVLTGHSGQVMAAKYSADGRLLATSAAGGTVQIWETQTLSPSVVIQTQKSPAMVLLAFDPAGTRLAVGSGFGNAAIIYNCKTGEQRAQLTGHTGGLSEVVFSPDGKQLATGGYDNTVRIWDAESGKPGPVLLHEAIMDRLSFSPDSSRLATAGIGTAARVWEVKTGKLIDLPLKTQGMVRSVKFSPDGKRLVSAGEEKAVRVWDAETGKPLAELRGLQLLAIHVAFSPDGQHIVGAGSDTSAYIWDIATGKTLAVLPHGGQIMSVAYSTDGARIVTTSADNLAHVWDGKTGKLISAIGNALASVKTLAFNEDAKSIVTAHVDGTVRTWDVQTGRIEAAIGSSGSLAGTASFSPDAKRIAAATGYLNALSIKEEHLARIWTEGANEPSFELRDRSVGVNEAWFNNDGKLAITVNMDFTAQVWDAATGKSRVDLGVGSYGPVGGVPPAAAISSNDKFMALTGPNGQVRLWDLVSLNRKPLIALTGPGVAVQSVAISPDNTTVLAMYVDGTARLSVIDSLKPFDQLYEDARRLVRMLKKELTEDGLQSN